MAPMSTGSSSVAAGSIPSRYLYQDGGVGRVSQQSTGGSLSQAVGVNASGSAPGQVYPPLPPAVSPSMGGYFGDRRLSQFGPPAVSSPAAAVATTPTGGAGVYPPPPLPLAPSVYPPPQSTAAPYPPYPLGPSQSQAQSQQAGVLSTPLRPATPTGGHYYHAGASQAVYPPLPQQQQRPVVSHSSGNGGALYPPLYPPLGPQGQPQVYPPSPLARPASVLFATSTGNGGGGALYPPPPSSPLSAPTSVYPPPSTMQQVYPASIYPPPSQQQQFQAPTGVYPPPLGPLSSAAGGAAAPYGPLYPPGPPPALPPRVGPRPAGGGGLDVQASAPPPYPPF
ncbi:hypothetical protein H9P43_002845 [Blastocladiella emersonii ATCC 22665]|nr:hypothetical protein H9P43_002845 [Blastocladiella emersonii ATCC 22665]